MQRNNHTAEEYYKLLVRYLNEQNVNTQAEDVTESKVRLRFVPSNSGFFRR